jgi:adenosyl cobinamide kinase/adenosyl cobinamide phosphate guanylyltransferase
VELILVTGGVRSGKSDYALKRALAMAGHDVTFIGTARVDDDDAEMADRVARHRAERPRAWISIDAPARAGDAIRRAPFGVVILDCMTVLTANALMREGVDDGAACYAAAGAEVDGILEASRSRAGTLIVVTNEVGWSVHPPTAIGRWFCDVLGHANRNLAAAAIEVVLMVCGLPVVVKSERGMASARP